MEPLAITQCFEKVGEPFDRKKEEFFLDMERQCYGQRWSIPRAYYSHKYVSYGPITESLFIEVGHPGLTPGAFIPRDKFVRLFNQIEITPLFTGSTNNFEKRVREIKNSIRSGGIIPTDRFLFGMRVYEEAKGRNEYSSAYLFPDGKATLFADCLTRPGTTIEQKFSHGTCIIVGNVDDRVTVKYRVEYVQMPNIVKLNNEMVQLLQTFMVNH